MNKIDLGSTGAVKTQKCEQIHTRSEIFSAITQIFSNSVQDFQKPQGFFQKTQGFSKKTQGFPKKLNASEATSLSRPPKKCSKN